MTCSDEDLKKLKESEPDDCEWVMDWNSFQALLARLEAAEKAVYHLTQIFDDDMESVEYTHGIGDEADQALEAWRKSKGE